MSDPQLRIEPLRATVEPGGQVSVTLTVHNPSAIVEGYRLEVLGPAAAWSQVLPPELSVYPQQDATAVVVLTPPTGAQAPGGDVAVGVKAQSTVDAAVSAVAECDVEVGKQYGLQAKLVPVTSFGRWRGRHAVQVSNWGNSAVQLKLSASDPDEALDFIVKPDTLDLPLGGKAMARIWVRTRHPFLRGSPVRLPFQITCEPAGREITGPVPTVSQPDRPIIDGALTQKPILSRAAVVAATLLLGAAIALGIWGFKSLKDHPIPPADSGPLAPATPATPAKVTTPVLRVTRINETLVRLDWDEAKGPVSGYQTQQVLPGPPVSSVLDPATHEKDQLSVVVTPREGVDPECFRLRVLGDGTDKSDWSVPTCLPPPEETPPPDQNGGGDGGGDGGDDQSGSNNGGNQGGTGDSTPPTPDLTPDEIAVVIPLKPNTDPAEVQKIKDLLTTAAPGKTVVSTASAAYAGLTARYPGGADVVAVQPYADAEEAQAFCGEYQDSIEESSPGNSEGCTFETPGPKQ